MTSYHPNIKMQLLYTNENRFLVYNILNLMEREGISTLLKNEYASSAAGDLAPHETWLELWVREEADFNRAKQIMEQAFDPKGSAWFCPHCQEHNDASFEFCWQCQTERPDDTLRL